MTDENEMRSAYIRAKARQTDDIVTRLRNKYQGQLPILLEAADYIEHLKASVINTFDNGFDEIERLRTRIKELEAECRRLERTAYD